MDRLQDLDGMDLKLRLRVLPCFFGWAACVALCGAYNPARAQDEVHPRRFPDREQVEAIRSVGPLQIETAGREAEIPLLMNIGVENTHTPTSYAQILDVKLEVEHYDAAGKPMVRTAPGDSLIGGLRAGHPRLLFTVSDEARLAALAGRDTLLAALINQVRRRAEAALAEPAVEYVLRGPRLLAQSRLALERVLALALAYRLSDDARYRGRAVAALQAAAAFPDWNPSHFLDVAEMTAAFAIGYDWLFEALAPEERTFIREALIEQGLKPGLEAYEADAWWREQRPNNWNQVCNGGLTMGALALAEEEPALARRILAFARPSIPHGMKAYRPEGQYVEGPSYWDYGTTYNALLIAALESALGTDWGLKQAPGFAQTGAYRLQTVSPTRRYFNYADGRAGADPSPTMFWLAGAFDRPDYARFHRTWLAERLRASSAPAAGPVLPGRFMPLEVVWYQEEAGEVLDPPLDALFRGEGDVVTLRSGWHPEALYVGFKGGKNDASHAHLDIGTFVLEADGVRWAVDLGPDDYNLPGYWESDDGGRRWTYYRLGTKSHNTLVLGDRNQRAHAAARVVAYQSTPERAHAVVDMGEAYEGPARQARRGVAVLDRSRVLVQDEVMLQEPLPVRWGMVTEAEVELEGAAALLRQDGAALRVEILEPSGARFELVSTDPGDERQHGNEGTHMLAAILRPGADGPVRLAILLTPQGSSWPVLPVPALQPLSTWEDGRDL